MSRCEDYGLNRDDDEVVKKRQRQNIPPCFEIFVMESHFSATSEFAGGADRWNNDADHR